MTGWGDIAAFEDHVLNTTVFYVTLTLKFGNACRTLPTSTTSCTVYIGGTVNVFQLTEIKAVSDSTKSFCLY